MAPTGAVEPCCGRLIAIALVVIGESGMLSDAGGAVGDAAGGAGVPAGVGGGSVGMSVGMVRGGADVHAASAAAAQTTNANRVKAERWLIPSTP